MSINFVALTQFTHSNQSITSIMAEGEDGFQNSKNYEYISSGSSPDLSDQSITKTDFGAVQPQQNTNENIAKTSKENEGCSSSKLTFFMLFLRAKFIVIL